MEHSNFSVYYTDFQNPVMQQLKCLPKELWNFIVHSFFFLFFDKVCIVFAKVFFVKIMLYCKYCSEVDMLINCINHKWWNIPCKSLYGIFYCLIYHINCTFLIRSHSTIYYIVCFVRLYIFYYCVVHWLLMPCNDTKNEENKDSDEGRSSTGWVLY